MIDFVSYSVTTSVGSQSNFYKFSLAFHNAKFALQKNLGKTDVKLKVWTWRKLAFLKCLSKPNFLRVIMSTTICSSRSGRWCSCNKPRAWRILKISWWPLKKLPGISLCNAQCAFNIYFRLEINSEFCDIMLFTYFLLTIIAYWINLMDECMFFGTTWG